MTGRPSSPPVPARARQAPTRALRLHGTIARKLGIAIVAGEYKPGDLESIAGYYRNHRKKGTPGFSIDDITWRDLDMGNRMSGLRWLTGMYSG